MDTGNLDHRDKPSAATERVRSPRGQGDRLRAEILAAVARLLDEQVRHPDLNLSLREVGRATGISAQGVYLHFPNKEALAWAAAADGYDRLLAAMRTAAESAEGPAIERLRAQAHAFWQFADANRGVFRLMFGHDISQLGPTEWSHPGGQLWQQWLDAVRACEAEETRWPERARRDGVEQVALHLWSALLGRYALCATTFGRTGRDSLRAFTDYLVDQLLTPG